MSTLSQLLKSATSAVVRSLGRGPRPGATDRRTRSAGRGRERPPTGANDARSIPARPAGNGQSAVPTEPSPGQLGPNATVEVDPQQLGHVRMGYNPDTDGAPDPGEIVWTWVPFEENDGRGKDRPVLVVAAEGTDSVLAVQLTSKDHDGQQGFVTVGAGSWDGEHRPSWVNIDRVIRVHADGMRREAAALDRENYGRVEAALRARYGWR